MKMFKELFKNEEEDSEGEEGLLDTLVGSSKKKKMSETNNPVTVMRHLV